MTSLFPVSGGGELSRDAIVAIIVQTQEQVKAVTMALRELKDELKIAISELSDRFDADTDTLRESVEGFGDLKRRVVDIEKRQEVVAGNIDLIAKRVTDLENSRLEFRAQIKTWVTALGGAGMVLGWLFSRLFPK